MRHSIRRIPIWAYSLLLLVIIVLSSFVVAHLQSPVDGAYAHMVGEECMVMLAQDESPSQKAGLIPGDKIKKIGDQQITCRGHTELLESYRSGDVESYLVDRNGEFLTLEVTLESRWSQNRFYFIAFYILILIVSTSSIWIIYKRPYDLTARLFFIYIQLFALAQNFSFINVDNHFVIFGAVIFNLSFNLFGVVLLHFHLNFPSPVSYYHKVKGALKAMYFTGITVGVAVNILLLRKTYIDAESTLALFDMFNRISISWMALTLALALAVAINQFNHAKNTHERKQLRLVLIGSAFGLITPIMYGIYPAFIWHIENERQLLNILGLTNGAGTYIMTTFLVFALFRYRIWNIEVFIRRALLYSIATIVVLLSYFLLLQLVNVFLIEETRLTHFMILAVSSIAFLLLRDVIQKLIDRLFYRESYNLTQVVEAFEKENAGIYNFEKLSLGVTNSFNKIFHARTILLALKVHHHTFKLIQSQGFKQADMPEEFAINDEVDSFLMGTKIFSIEEIKDKPPLLRTCKGELVIPLINDGQTFGFFVLGNKLSETSYTLQDIGLLSLLSKRVVTLIQSARLYERDLNRQLTLEKERNRIAKDIHDDVGASLTRISMMSELINTKNSDPVAVRRWLQGIVDTCREVTQDMTQIIWALSPKSNTFEGLLAYLRRYTLEYLEPANIDCVFHFPLSVEEAQLRPEARRNVYLCIREALHNIVKHSKAGKVMITVQNDHDWFTVSVKDNGNGFDSDNMKWHGNGLINMKNRMKVIGGETTIRAKSGEGAEVLFRIPLKSLP